VEEVDFKKEKFRIEVHDEAIIVPSLATIFSLIFIFYF
jgi:hypothetical protein